MSLAKMIYGQFFTPATIAEYMAGLTWSFGNAITVLGIEVYIGLI